MRELVLVYSFTGKTKLLAEAFARENSLDLREVCTEKKLSKLQAYTAGCIRAIKGKEMPIAPIALTDCATAHIFAPIWAGSVAPPMNCAIAKLPKGAKLFLHMVSGSGNSSQDQITARLKALGFEVIGYEDIRG